MKKGEIAKTILLAVATITTPEGFFITLTGAAGVGMMIKPLGQWYRQQDRYGKYRIRKTFAQLQRERFIEMSETPDGKAKVVLTEAGKKRILKYQFEDLKIEPIKKWDKKWRMVIFDIPESIKEARNALRSKLQELGFYKLQKSVWIYPYECRNEIDFIVDFFNVGSYVRIAEVNSFDGDKLVKKEFNL